MSLDLVFVGEDLEHSLGKMCMRGAERTGHSVSFVDKTPFTFNKIKLPGSDWQFQRELLKTVREVDPDIVFIIKGENISKNTIHDLKKECDTFVYNWNPDNPFMSRSEKRRLQTYLEAGPEYDGCFIWSKTLAEQLEQEYGFDDIFYLPFAHDPDLHRPLPPNKDYQCEVIFAGMYSEKREEMLSELATSDIDLSIYGSYWKRKCGPEVEDAVEGSKLLGEAYATAYSSAKMVLNVLAEHNLDDHNMRTFETPATGTLMLTPDTTGQREFFDDDEVAYYSSPSDLLDQVKYYLEHEQERERIAANGRKAVKEHTYRARMETVVEVYRNQVTGV